MKKLFLITFCAFVLTSCASVKNDTLPRGVRCDVIIDDKTASICAEYSGENWVFIYGVDLKNSRGETKFIKFKTPSRTVQKNGRVHECGVCVSVFPEKWAEFVDGGEVLAKVRASRGWYDFEPANVWRKD